MKQRTNKLGCLHINSLFLQRCSTNQLLGLFKQENNEKLFAAVGTNFFALMQTVQIVQIYKTGLKQVLGMLTFLRF